MNKTVTVSEKTKYGFKAGEDEYRFTKASRLTNDFFEIGDALEIDTWVWGRDENVVGKNVGKNFVKNAKVLNKTTKKPEAKASNAPAFDRADATPAVSTTGDDVPMRYGKPISPYEVTTELQIHVSGIKQALINSPTVASWGLDQETFVQVVKELTIEFIGQVKSITGRK